MACGPFCWIPCRIPGSVAPIPSHPVPSRLIIQCRNTLPRATTWWPCTIRHGVVQHVI
jgi:hypothetical protein